MTLRQQRFIDEYLIDLNATAAAKRAGYSEKTAYTVGQKLTKHHEVKKAIAKEMEKRKNANIATVDEILNYLTDVIRGKETDEVVSFGDLGVERTTKQVSSKDRIRAAELLAKRYQIFADNINMNVTPSEKFSEIVAQIGGKGLDE